MPLARYAHERRVEDIAAELGLTAEVIRHLRAVLPKLLSQAARP
jgi:hypothetical protein